MIHLVSCSCLPPRSRIRATLRSVSCESALPLSKLMPMEVSDAAIHSSDVSLLDFRAAVCADGCIGRVWSQDDQFSVDLRFCH
jgi:hypothetical protein